MSELRDIPGFIGIYSITCDGRVWSYRHKKWRKPNVNAKGYPCVSLCVNYVSRNKPIHRLVALAWVPRVAGANFVNHKDGIKSNIQDSNLEWCTKSHDVQHAWNTGLMTVTQVMRDNCSRIGKKYSKLTDEQANEIRDLAARGLSQRSIGAMFGVSRESARDIIHGRNHPMKELACPT